MFQQYTWKNYLLCILLLCTILLGMSCRQSFSEANSLGFEVFSVYDDYSSAADLAHNWHTGAELVNVKILYEEIRNKESDHYIRFRFESKSLTEESIIVICENHICESMILQNRVIGDQVQSVFGYGISPIELGKIVIDSNEAMEIASDHIRFDLEEDREIFNLVLSRDFDTDDLLWSVSAASYSSNISNYFAYVEIDPITGEILDISD